jgi:hypothetical protein
MAFTAHELLLVQDGSEGNILNDATLDNGNGKGCFKDVGGVVAIGFISRDIGIS